MMIFVMMTMSLMRKISKWKNRRKNKRVMNKNKKLMKNKRTNKEMLQLPRIRTLIELMKKKERMKMTLIMNMIKEEINRFMFEKKILEQETIYMYHLIFVVFTF